MAMATAAQATATPSPPSTAAAPAGRNQVQRRAVAPKVATTAPSTRLQTASAASRPVGWAVVSSAAPTPAATIAAPNTTAWDGRVAMATTRGFGSGVSHMEPVNLRVQGGAPAPASSSLPLLPPSQTPGGPL